MTDPHVPLSDDELLSAYLDGALAGEELARAQRLLIEQPGSRHLLEELRALGHGLRELPRGRLGDSFPERVMRKAERELLTGAVEPAAHAADSVRSRLRNKRPWIYAAATLAAGLLVAVFSWQYQPSRRDLAENRASPLARARSAPVRASAEATQTPPVALKAAPAASAAADDIPLRAALTRLGLVPLSDEIVRQVRADEAAAPPAASQPLSLWSCTVSADDLEQDVLGRVLTQNRVQVLDEHALDSAAARPADAVNETAGAAKRLVDVVLVTATPGQLDAALDDIRSQSHTFRNLTHFGLQSPPAISLDKRVPSSAMAAAQPGQGQPPSGDQTGRAVRLRLSNQSQSALQTPPLSAAISSSAATPSATDSAAKKGMSHRAKRKSEPLSDERTSAKNHPAGKLQRALFILRSSEPIRPPGGASPAKEEP